MEKTDHSRIALDHFLATANELLDAGKLTDPQKKIVAKLNEGYTLGTNNPHYRNGGEIVWVHPITKKPEYAGHVYRALHALQWRVQKHLNLSYIAVQDLFTHEFNVGRL